MILVPKLLEFLALSILPFVHTTWLLHCIYLSIVYFVLGNSMLEPLFEDFSGASL
jgi:hypothetical protein